MASEGDISAISTASIEQDGGKKLQKEKKNLKKNEEILSELIPSEALTFYLALTTEVNDNEQATVHGRHAWNIVDCKGGYHKVGVEILGKHLNNVDSKFKTLKEFTFEETNNIRKSSRGIILWSMRWRRLSLPWSIGTWMH